MHVFIGYINFVTQCIKGNFIVVVAFSYSHGYMHQKSQPHTFITLEKTSRHNGSAPRLMNRSIIPVFTTALNILILINLNA